MTQTHKQKIWQYQGFHRRDYGITIIFYGYRNCKKDIKCHYNIFENKKGLWFSFAIREKEIWLLSIEKKILFFFFASFSRGSREGM